MQQQTQDIRYKRLILFQLGLPHSVVHKNITEHFNKGLKDFGKLLEIENVNGFQAKAAANAAQDNQAKVSSLLQQVADAANAAQYAGNTGQLIHDLEIVSNSPFVTKTSQLKKLLKVLKLYLLLKHPPLPTQTPVNTNNFSLSGSN